MRRRDEERIQRAIVQHLTTRGVPNLLFFHCPNGGFRRPAEAAILKGLGVKAGVADLILLHNSYFYALELKTHKGKVTPAQQQFLDSVCDAGGFSAVAHGLDEAIKFLESWKLLRGKVQ